MSRLTPGMMTVVVFALLAGLGGAYVVRHQMRVVPAPVASAAAPAPDTMIVPVALTALEKGRVVTQNDIGIRRMSKAEYLKSPYATMEFLTSPQQIQGRALRISLKEKEVFTPDALLPYGDALGVEDRLEPGLRAVTVPVRNIGAVQGFARPGSYVDVLFRSHAEGKRPEATMTLLQRVQVLAIGTAVVSGQSVQVADQGNVTLAVTPNQAMNLKVVEDRGELSLVLRNADDDLQFMPFDESMEKSLSRLVEQGIIDPVQFANATKAVGRARAADSAVGAVDSADHVDRVVGNASELITIDDLLGIPTEPETSEMEIFMGPTKTVQTFEEPAESSLEVLRRGRRIQTPIVGYPPIPSRRTALTASPSPYVSRP